MTTSKAKAKFFQPGFNATSLWHAIVTWMDPYKIYDTIIGMDIITLLGIYITLY